MLRIKTIIIKKFTYFQRGFVLGVDLQAHQSTDLHWQQSSHTVRGGGTKTHIILHRQSIANKC
jgi:hypothetical protein